MPNLDGQKWVSPPQFNGAPGQDHEESSGTPEPRSRPMRGRPRQSRPAGASTGSPSSSHPGQPSNGRPNVPNAQPNSPQGASLRPPRRPQPPQPPQPGGGPSPARRHPQRPQPPQPPQPVVGSTFSRSNKKKGTWKGLFFKLFLAYSAFLLLFTCPPTQPLTDDMPCLCRKLHNRIDDLRPFYSQHLAPHINPQLERPVVQKAKTVVVPFVHRAVDASSGFYNSKVRPHLESAASKILTAAENQAQPQLAKLQPHLAAAFSKAQELKSKFVDPAFQKSLKYHEQYGKPALDRADAFVQTKVRPHVNQAAAIGAHHGQLYWAVFRKWFHEHVVLSVLRFYSQTVLPSIDKIRDRLNSRTENAAQQVAGISIEPFAQEATPEPPVPTSLDAEVTPALEVEFGVPEPMSVVEEPAAPKSTFVEHEIPPVEVHMPDIPAAPKASEETLYDADQVASALDSAPEPPTKDIPEEAIEEYIEELKEKAKSESEPVIEFNTPVEEPKVETKADPAKRVVRPSKVSNKPGKPVPHPSNVNDKPVKPVAEPSKINFEAKASTEKIKLSWAARVDRTAQSALKTLQKDVEASCKEILASSKPQFVKLLREISQYGESKVEELTKIVDDVENDETVYEDDNIVNEFTLAADHINELSNDVRGQALTVAEKALERTEELRKQTLEALDDFFDVILLEAGRQSVDDEEDEFAKWKEYHQLKEHLNSVRSGIEAHDIDMEVINASLREPQQAAILMAQEFMNHVNSLRAKTQFLVQQRLLQKRSAEEESEDKPESSSISAQEVSATPKVAESTLEAEPTPNTTSEVVIPAAASPEDVDETGAEDLEEEYVETVISTRFHTQTIVKEVELPETEVPEVPEVVIQTMPIKSDPEEAGAPEAVIQTVPIETDPEEPEIPEAVIQTVPIDIPQAKTGSEPSATASPQKAETFSEPEVVIQTVPIVADPEEVEASSSKAVIQTAPIEVDSEDVVQTTTSETEPQSAIQTVSSQSESSSAPSVSSVSSQEEPQPVSSAEPVETVWEDKTPPFQYVGTEVEDPVTVYETQVVTKVVHDDL